MTIALFVGSFDPVHNGHLDIIIKASLTFEKLLVAVLSSDHKINTLFSYEQRLLMLEQAINQLNLPNVSVLKNTENQLLTDVYILNGCDLLIRGIRNKQDEEYELKSLACHKLIYPGLEIKFIGSRHSLAGLSSSFLKSALEKNIYINSGKVFNKKNGDHEMDHYDFDSNPRLIPVFIKKQLEEILLGQYKIAITGQIGVGKSYIAAELARYICENYEYNCQVITFDNLIREIYDDDNCGSQNLRDELQRIYGPGNVSDDEILSSDRKKVIQNILAKKMFHQYDPEDYNARIAGKQEQQDYYRRRIQQQILPLLLIKYKEHLQKIPKYRTTIVIIEWAQLAEMNMGNWTNHNVIVVESSNRAKFLQKRGLTLSDIKNKSDNQYSVDQKINCLKQIAQKNVSEANIIRYNNSIENSEDNIKQLAEYLMNNVFNLT